MEENFANMEEHFTCMEDHSKNHVRACVFSVFRAVKILNGYNGSTARSPTQPNPTQMKRAQNSDSITHVKK